MALNKLNKSRHAALHQIIIKQTIITQSKSVCMMSNLNMNRSYSYTGRDRMGNMQLVHNMQLS